MSEIKNMDVVFFRFINNLAGQSEVFDLLGVFAASGLIWVMLFFLLGIFVGRPSPREHIHELATVFLAGLASLFAYVTNYLISLVYFRARPFAALSDMHQLIIKETTDKSFPSDHAALAFALAVAVLLAHRKWGMAFFVMAAFVALGRVFVGVHYPADVLAGAAVGGLWAFLVCHYGRGIINRLLSRHSIIKHQAPNDK